MKDEIIFQHITFMQRDTKKTVDLYDVTSIVPEDGNHETHIKGKTNINGNNKKITIYNTRIIYKEEDEQS